MRTSLLLVLASFAFAACGSGQTPGKRAGEGAVDVRVRQVMDVSNGVYTEGSYSYIRIERSNGDKALEEKLPEPVGDDQTFISEAVIRLDPGDYNFVSFQRPCDGDCGLLDPPTDKCERSIRVEGALDVTVTVRPGDGCTIEASGAAQVPSGSTAVSNEEALRLIRSCQVTEYLTLHEGETRLTRRDGSWVYVIRADNDVRNWLVVPAATILPSA